MAGLKTAIVPRRKPNPAIRASGDREVRLATPPIDEGDPFGFSHKVEPSRFYMEGRQRAHPGSHHNVYTAIPQLQSIAEKFWGGVRRLRYKKVAAIPKGIHQGRMAGGTDINVPERTTYASFATHNGYEREAIRNGYSHIVR